MDACPNDDDQAASPTDEARAEAGAVVEAQPAETGPEASPPDGGGLPPDPGEALAMLAEALTESERKAEQAQLSYLRAVADLDNYRKRMRREQSNIATRATGRTVASLLPVLDSFDAALAAETTSDHEQGVLAGLRATYDLMMSTLGNQGLELVAADGEDFSPEVHEAINAPPEGDGPVIVSNEVRRGYRLDGRLLRAALVMVTRRGVSE